MRNIRQRITGNDYDNDDDNNDDDEYCKVQT